MSYKIIKNLFSYALQEGASDLVISGAPARLFLNYRFPDGSEKTFSLPKKLEKNLFASLYQLMMIAPGELTVKKPGRFSHKKQDFAFYLTILPEHDQEKIIISIIDKKTPPFSLAQLGLQAADLKNLQTGLKKRSGLIVVSAPTGAGKSTTLRALLADLDAESLNIYVLSATPAAAPLPGINYLKINSDNLNHVLRHDSDVIAIDDVSKVEILSAAVRAATSGRLVLISFPAHNSLEALFKILKLPLAWETKISALNLILSQNLAKLKRKKLSRKNFRDTIGLFEVLKFSAPLKRLLQHSENDWNKKDWLLKFAQTAEAEGFRTIAEDRRKKIKTGLLKTL